MVAYCLYTKFSSIFQYFCKFWSKKYSLTHIVLSRVLSSSFKGTYIYIGREIERRILPVKTSEVGQLKLKISVACNDTVLKLLLTAHHRGWQSRMRHIVQQPCSTFYESGCLEMQPKMGGKLLLKLKIGTRLIASNYRKGKMKSTSKRKIIVRETTEREAHEISNALLRFRQFCLVACILWIRMDCLCLSSDQNYHIFEQCASTAVLELSHNPHKKVGGFGLVL